MFGAISNWHPMLEKVDSEGNMVGTTRTAHAADGSMQVECLQMFDANRHIYRYTMESTPMPVHNYVSEFRIDDNGNGTSASLGQCSLTFQRTGTMRSLR